jgi:hypothetical protein
VKIIYAATAPIPAWRDDAEVIRMIPAHCDFLPAVGHPAISGIEGVLLAFRTVCPEPDKAGKALHDRRYDSIAGECVLDFLE